MARCIRPHFKLKVLVLDSVGGSLVPSSVPRDNDVEGNASRLSGNLRGIQDGSNAPTRPTPMSVRD